MSSTDTAILSRPRYGTLTAMDAQSHLFVADDAGANAIVKLSSEVDFQSAEIIYVSTADSNDWVDKLKALECPRLYVGPTATAAMPRLTRSLQRLRMGTQIYIAGSESFLGLATMITMQAGIDHQALQTEQQGSRARRIQCVHCKGLTENVTTQPAECAHCGLLLLVRDHYSRRVAAFQGVNINAENPSDIPDREEIYR